MTNLDIATQRVPIAPFDQLVITHPPLDHDSTPTTRYTLIDLTQQLGPSSVLLLALLNETRTTRCEHTTACDAGDLTRQLGLNAARFNRTVHRLVRFGYLTIDHTETHNGRQFIAITLTSDAAR